MARDRRFWMTALAVAGIFVFALFLRTYWYTSDAAPPGDFLLPESDSYYQHHTVERIQQEGWHQPIQDPLVNYPVGGINPHVVLEQAPHAGATRVSLGATVPTRRRAVPAGDRVLRLSAATVVLRCLRRTSRT